MTIDPMILDRAINLLWGILMAGLFLGVFWVWLKVERHRHG
jgi:hypothetical protein